MAHVSSVGDGTNANKHKYDKKMANNSICPNQIRLKLSEDPDSLHMMITSNMNTTKTPTAAKISNTITHEPSRRSLGGSLLFLLGAAVGASGCVVDCSVDGASVVMTSLGHVVPQGEEPQMLVTLGMTPGRVREEERKLPICSG